MKIDSLVLCCVLSVRCVNQLCTAQFTTSRIVLRSGLTPEELHEYAYEATLDAAS